ncbi:MAG: DUF523 and DUF1722 domain-containing protein [Candidatus Verstraetearchaeota archaeon]|nr:DUF523 and DUF1722 domain-containing protein [Candidatus Verstraetearchaeota archaeon]
MVVSKCLGFEHCRWNAQVISNDFVELLKKYVEFKTVCPEVEIGLGVPRNPIRVAYDPGSGSLRLIQPATGSDLTEKMQEFCNKFFESLEKVDGFILKGSSPSCGLKNVKVYAGIGSPYVKEKGRGFFGSAVLEKFPRLAVEDEERLSNPLIREHFLTKLFALAGFRKANETSNAAELVKFHSENKFLLMAYSQGAMRELGKLVANQNAAGIEKSFLLYRETLENALYRPPKRGSVVNVLSHMYGYFSQSLNVEEKKFFAEAVENYRKGITPLIVSLNLVRSYAIRFGIDYLLRQSFLEPYPLELMERPTYDEDRDYWRF